MDVDDFGFADLWRPGWRVLPLCRSLYDANAVARLERESRSLLGSKGYAHDGHPGLGHKVAGCRLSRQHAAFGDVESGPLPDDVVQLGGRHRAEGRVGAHADASEIVCLDQRAPRNRLAGDED